MFVYTLRMEIISYSVCFVHTENKYSLRQLIQMTNQGKSTRIRVRDVYDSIWQNKSSIKMLVLLEIKLKDCVINRTVEVYKFFSNFSCVLLLNLFTFCRIFVLRVILKILIHKKLLICYFRMHAFYVDKMPIYALKHNLK